MDEAILAEFAAETFITESKRNYFLLLKEVVNVIKLPVPGFIFLNLSQGMNEYEPEYESCSDQKGGGECLRPCGS